MINKILKAKELLCLLVDLWFFPLKPDQLSYRGDIAQRHAGDLHNFQFADLLLNLVGNTCGSRIERGDSMIQNPTRF